MAAERAPKQVSTFCALCVSRCGAKATITDGASVPGTYLPDLDHAGCILYWGYNPSVARLAHATSTVAALARGALALTK